ncbi:MAG: hypothetical protein LC799_33500, partial [Actinobacteria bacterium]|nr:hypothetical protein [Actinomycetota bacterium]
LSGSGSSSRPPIGWLYLPEGYTVCWQRGDKVAYVFKGKQMDAYPHRAALGIVPVSPTGWTDVADIRAAGERWLKQW